MRLSPPGVLRAVIFDFDGVLADTMSDNLRAWQHAFAQHGVALDAHAYYPLEGMGRNEIAETLCRRYAVRLMHAADIAREKERFYLSENHFRLYPGIPETLRTLHDAGIHLALVTGASRERLESSLDQTIRAFFSSIVTSDDVATTKPDPEPYMKALAELNETAEHSVAIENAPLGITSAKEAGLFCIALCTTLPADMLGRGDLILKTHADLPPFFSRYTSPDGPGKAALRDSERGRP